MKNTYKYILALAAGLAILPLTSSAQTTQDSGVVTDKYVSEADDDGIYTLTLETYVTGAFATETVPADIILVLDTSGSMEESIGDEIAYKKAYTWNSLQNKDKLNASKPQGYYTDFVGSAEASRYVRYYNNKWQYRNSVVGWEDIDGSIYKHSIYQSKLGALMDAATSFINAVSENAKGEDGLAGTSDDTNHKMGIVSFSDEAETLSPLVNVIGNESTLESKVIGAEADGSTAADYGLQRAYEILNARTDTTGRAAMVILFTDGEPNHGSDFDSDVANDAISISKTLKNTKGISATVYTVGCYDSASDNMTKYMNYVSSNYPTASSLKSPGTQASDKYYYMTKDAIQLTKIFSSIADDLILSVTKKSVVLDVITNSFEIPDGYDETNILFYTSNATMDGATVSKWGDWQSTTDVTATIYKRTDGSGKTDVVASGYDFVTHWVGKDAPSPQKLIMTIPIVPKDGAVGGKDIPTNTDESGLYEDEDEDGNPDEDGKIEEYEIPHVDLPVKIQITKKGLQPGESADFTIDRRLASAEDIDANYTYFTKVILTGSSTDPSPKVVLQDLDPSYIYRITEGDWSWTYEVTNVTGKTKTTKDVEVNPFEFSNAKKDGDIPQNNAEAIAHNVFEKTK